MNKMNKKEIIKKLEKSFVKEDKAEPFLDREYVEETKRIYKLLKNNDTSSDFIDATDKAIYDIVEDIFREIKK